MEESQMVRALDMIGFPGDPTEEKPGLPLQFLLQSKYPCPAQNVVGAPVKRGRMRCPLHCDFTQV